MKKRTKYLAVAVVLLAVVSGGVFYANNGGNLQGLITQDPSSIRIAIPTVAMDSSFQSSSANRYGSQSSKEAIMTFYEKSTGDRVFLVQVNVDLVLNENWADFTNPIKAYLKQNGKTIATANVDLDEVGKRTGKITFIPYSSTRSISGTNVFVVEMDTNTAITNDSSATEHLAASIDIGYPSTPGDIYWYDGRNVVKYVKGPNNINIFMTTSY